MSQDTFTTVTNRSWFGRMGNSFGGALFGLVAFLLSFALLFWNEGRAVQRAKTLEAGERHVVSVAASPILPENDGRLVHVTGEVTAGAAVADPVFGLEWEALRLRRSVEMFQWVEESKSETREKLGGGEETTTTYTYSKRWESSPVDSSAFAQPAGHQNPKRFPVEPETFAAPEIQLGDFGLSESLVDQLGGFEDVTLGADDADVASGETGRDLRAVDGALFLGADPTSPQVGDVRIAFSAVFPGVYSIVAGQSGDGLAAFDVPKLGTLEMAAQGAVSSEAMFRAEREGNAILTWLLRLAGFVFMTLGLNLMISPLAVFASVVPFFGRIVGAGIGFIAIALALPLTLVTIGVAWLAYRPWIGIPLLVLAAAAFVFGILRWRKARPVAA
ncbi:MAG: TMEM43 family protein [Terrimicrobiaceae bacterium]|nr:TMEM43 family protein [Terrimicrobiaceae bacterium]